MRFRLLGPMDVVDGDRVVGIGGGRQRALLAALLLRPNEVVSTERLIDELWSDHRPETATTALHGLVSALRKVLEPDVLVTRAPGYMLRLDEADIDAVEFERLLDGGRQELAAGNATEAADTLRRALALWRGPALAEVADREFAQIEAQRLDELRLQALEERIEADLQLGRSHELVPELEALVAREPLRDRPCALLMRALYGAGRQADALEVYRQARRRLVDELGLEPSRPLQELEQAILRQDPALGAVAESPRPIVHEGRRRPRRVVAVLVLAVVAAAMALVAAFAFDRVSTPALAGVDTDHLGIIDPRTNKIVGEIAVGQRPAAVAVGDGSVWVANAGSGGTVTRIDPHTRRVMDTIGIGAPASSLAVTRDAVWVGNGSDGTVSKIDPSSDSVIEVIDLRGPNLVVPNGVQSLAVANGSLWVAVGPSSLLRFDLRTGKKTWIPLGSPPLAVAAGAGAVWVTTGDEQLFRIDQTTGKAAEPLQIRTGVDLAVGYGRVWVMDGALSAIDTRSLVFEGGSPLHGPSFPIAVAAGYRAVWWLDNFAGVLYRTDPDDVQRLTKIALGHGRPADVAVGAGEVWVCVQ
jgi:DNA-binding SARP family transcriptional activator